MDNFLSNSHYQQYGGKDINYRYFICKDCSQKKKEYEPGQETDELPKNILNIGYINVLSNNKPIKVTTPLMVAPFGFDKNTNQMYLQFTNVKTDSEMEGFFEFIQKLEFNQMQYLGLSEEDSELYLSQIKFPKNEKYDPNLVVKIPFRSNRYDVDIRTRDKDCSIANIYKFSKVRCDIYIDHIWKFNGRFVCKWKVNRVLIE